MSNLLAVLEGAIATRETNNEKLVKTHATVMEWTGRNREASIEKDGNTVEKPIVSFYALLEGETKVKVTAWPESSFAQLPSFKEGRFLKLSLREEESYTREGEDKDGKPYAALRQFSLIKMGEGSKLEGGFQMFQKIADAAEAKARATTAVSLEMKLDSKGQTKAFPFGEKAIAIPVGIVKITKGELGTPGKDAMLIVSKSVLGTIAFDGTFIEGVVIADSDGWDVTDEHGIKTYGATPKFHLQKGATGATQEAAILAFYGNK